MNDLEKLSSLEKESNLVSSLSGVLSWDQQCSMPIAGAEYRSTQLTYLAERQHELETSHERETLLNKIEDNFDNLEEGDKRSVILARRNFDLMKKLPQSLVKSLTQEITKGYTLWEDAKNNNDDSEFLPQLEKIIHLAKEKAKCLNIDSKNLYNSLLSEFEWGTTCKNLDKTFGELKNKIPDLLAKITQEGKFKNKMEGLRVKVSEQEKIGYDCLGLMRFDPDHCLLNIAAHPFSTTLGPNDFRITTRYDETDLASSLLSTAHEMGHSLYEQGLPKELYGTAKGKACSYGFHESQSLFWEKKVVSSKPFLEHLWPNLSKAIQADKNKYDLDTVYHSFNQVKNSLIRVDSDEVTYCLHIIIRYEMEKLLINEDLSPKDIEETWNKKYEDYLGIRPKDKSTSYLQDVHWAGGAFGYFPSYAIGHLISSQIEEKLERDLGTVEDLVSERKFPEIISWLKKNVHDKASSHDPSSLIKIITNKELSTKPFLSYLEKKFL